MMQDQRNTAPGATLRERIYDIGDYTGHRRLAGALLGAGLGLVYGLVSQTINGLALPGITLHQPPFGIAGNTVLTMLAGCVLGVLTCWPASAALGVFAASIAAAGAIAIGALLRLSGLITSSVAVLLGIVFSLPLAWFLVPVTAFLRWVADGQVDAQIDRTPLLARLRLPLVLLLVVVLLASFELMDAGARAEMKDMDAMIKVGLQAPGRAALPEPLRDMAVTRFPVGGATTYTLQWTQEDLDRFISLRPAANYDQHAAIIARFEDGYELVCLYPSPRIAPNCADL